MDIVFFGSSEFALPLLKSLMICTHKILCVVTQPDRPKGRHLYLSGTAIKSLACQAGLKVYQPEDINTAESIRFLRGLKVDLFVVISYGQILSSEILAIPEKISINAHASLLPKYRGAAPINWAIINGEKETGVTIIKLTPQMDAGPIILQESVKINHEDTDVILEDTLSKMASHLLLKALDAVTVNGYKLLPQDESKASLAPKLKRENGLIDWEEPAANIYNLIRAITRWPGAFTYYKDKLLKIYKAKVINFTGYQGTRWPGEIIEINKNGIIVATGRGGLIIEELQLEGRKRIKSEEFISGHKINIGERFARNIKK